MQTYRVTAERIDSHGSVAHAKAAEVVLDTDMAGRQDAMNPVELLLSALAACMLGAFVPTARVSAALVVSISLFGFLAAYMLGGAPEQLRTIALIDTIALAPLALVLIDVWRRFATS